MRYPMRYRLVRLEGMTPLRPSKNLVVVAALTLVYVIAGKLGLMVAFVHASATAVWPPTGIALAAFLLLGHRVWPAIWLGAFVVNITTAGSVATSIGIATGNTLEGLVGAYLVRRFAHGPYAFDHARDVFRFVVLTGLASTAVSATFGVTNLSLGGFSNWSDYRTVWWTWWLGEAAGAVRCDRKFGRLGGISSCWWGQHQSPEGRPV